MTDEKLYEILGDIDEKHIKEAKEYRKSKRPVWLKWSAIAACFAVVAAAGVFLLKDGSSTQTSLGGVMREYRDISVFAPEIAIEWTWEYKTASERFSTVTYDGNEYRIKTMDMALDPSLVSEQLGTCEATGYDTYTEIEYREAFEVWSINGISTDLMIAVEMDGQFYPFGYDVFIPPSTFGEVLTGYSLPQTLPLTRFAVYEDGRETGYYSLSDGDDIWQILSACPDAPFAEDGVWERSGKDYISFTATSESLGVYKRAFYVSADGYVWTNIFNWGYSFNIGTEAANEIIACAKKDAAEAEREPYTYSLAGTLTEIGDDYILVDDSILCKDADDGMIFRVPTSNLRISRCIDYQQVDVGDVVVISFIGSVDTGNENTVSGAVSMSKGTIQDGAVAVPE